MTLLPLEVVAVGEVVGADVAGGGYDDELAGGFQEVEVVAVFGLQLVEGGWVGDDGVGGGEVFLGRGAAGFLAVLFEVLLQFVLGAEGEVRSAFNCERIGGRCASAFAGRKPAARQAKERCQPEGEKRLRF